MFILRTVEGTRAYWTQAELQYAAEAAARCATVNCCASGNTCAGSAGVQNFAASKLLGMSIPSGNLSNFRLKAQACGNQVSFTYSFGLLTGALLPISAISMSATACNQA